VRKDELPEGWEERPLRDCVDVLDNLRVPVNSDERARRPGTIPYYGATGQVGWIHDFIFDEELLLLGEDGATFFDRSKNVAYIVSGKTWVNNHAKGYSLYSTDHYQWWVDPPANSSSVSRWEVRRACVTSR
jgi:type I restriction enzyme S subunit